jgi:cytochrome c5
MRDPMPEPGLPEPYINQRTQEYCTMNKLLVSSAVAAMLASGVALADGAATYNSACVTCHAPAIAPALKSPGLGDKAAWAPRIAKGMDALYASALNGVPGTAMAAKGGFANLSDDDVKAAVDYMVNSSK